MPNPRASSRHSRRSRSNSAWNGRHVLGLLAVLLGASLGLSRTAGAEEKKEPPKEPPLKYSAWCAFRSYKGVQQADAEEKKKKLLAADPTVEELTHTRPAAGRWGGFGKRGHWASLVVEMQNTTEKSVYKGNLAVRLDPSKEQDTSGTVPYTSRYRQEFELPPQTTQRHQFSVFCPEFNFGQIDVRIESNWGIFERTVFMQDLDLARDDLIVVVSDQPGAYSGLIDRKGAAVEDGSQPTGREVASVRVEDLPRRWLDLQMASLIILQGPPREGFSDDQLEALSGYCQGGGHLLVCANGKNPELLLPRQGQSRGLADLIGLKQVRQPVTVRALNTALGYPYTGPEGWELSLLDVTASDVTYVAGRNRVTDCVEVIQRRVGLGTITFLPFSPLDGKLDNWNGRLGIPLGLLKERRCVLFRTAADRLQPGEDDGSAPVAPSIPGQKQQVQPGTIAQLGGLRARLDDSFSRSTPVEPPPPGMVLSMLLLYLMAAVPLNYFAFGWFKRREAAWLAVPVHAIVFCGLFTWWGYYGKLGRLTVSEVTVAECGPKDGVAVARTFLAVYSPRYGDYRVAFSGPKRPAEEVQAGPGHLVNPEFKTRGLSELPELQLVDDGRTLEIEDLRVQARSTRSLEILHRANLGGKIEFSLVKNKDGATYDLSIANHTTVELLRPALLAPGPKGEMRGLQITDEGFLRAGDTHTLNGIPEASQDAAVWKDVNTAFFGQNVAMKQARGKDAEELQTALREYVSPRSAAYQQPLLAAWVDGGMLPLSMRKGQDPVDYVGRGFTLLLVPLTMRARGTAALTAGTDTSPIAYCGTLDLDGSDAKWQDPATGAPLLFSRRPSPPEGLLFFQFRPSPLLKLDDSRAALSFGFGALSEEDANARRLAPFRNLRGTVEWQVLEHRTHEKRWVPLPVPMQTFDLQPGGKSGRYRLPFHVAPQYLGPNRVITLRCGFRVASLSTNATRLDEFWPLTVEEPKLEREP